MEVVNCPKCRRLFTKIISPVCPQCEKLEEEQFQVLRTFIEDEPCANINEISRATGITTKRILAYIREGRIQVSEGLMGELKCRQCGEPIYEGNFCDSCTSKMAKNLSAAFGLAPDNKKPSNLDTLLDKGKGMHTRK